MVANSFDQSPEAVFNPVCLQKKIKSVKHILVQNRANKFNIKWNTEFCACDEFNQHRNPDNFKSCFLLLSLYGLPSRNANSSMASIALSAEKKTNDTILSQYFTHGVI